MGIGSPNYGKHCGDCKYLLEYKKMFRKPDWICTNRNSFSYGQAINRMNASLGDNSWNPYEAAARWLACLKFVQK